MDVYTGKRQVVTRAPVRNADFNTDNLGVVRFASGVDITNNANKLYYRADDKSEWTLINDEAATHHVETPLGFSADNRIAYLQVEQDTGPDAIDCLRRRQRQAQRSTARQGNGSARSCTSPGRTSRWARCTSTASRGLAFFDEASPEARLYRSLQAAFRRQRGQHHVEHA